MKSISIVRYGDKYFATLIENGTTIDMWECDELDIKEVRITVEDAEKK
jgi:hypothetical protein